MIPFNKPLPPVLTAKFAMVDRDFIPRKRNEDGAEFSDSFATVFDLNIPKDILQAVPDPTIPLGICFLYVSLFYLFTALY